MEIIKRKITYIKYIYDVFIINTGTWKQWNKIKKIYDYMMYFLMNTGIWKNLNKVQKWKS